MAKIPRVPVENQINTLSMVKIAIKFSPCTEFLFVMSSKVRRFHRVSKESTVSLCWAFKSAVKLSLGWVLRESVSATKNPDVHFCVMEKESRKITRKLKRTSSRRRRWENRMTRQLRQLVLCAFQMMGF